MSEVTVSVTLGQIGRIKNALSDARQNSQELLSIHDAALGRDTKKNALTAGMYKKEISDCEKLILELIGFSASHNEE